MDLVRGAAVLDEAIEQFSPSHIFLCLSGGNDSLSSTHFSARYLTQSKMPFTILHINTGIGIPETNAHVKTVCKLYGWGLLELRAKEDCGQDYEALVIEQGFPGPAHHNKMFNRLKERCVEKLLRDHKDGNRPVMLVSGMRQQESGKRMRLKSDPIQRKGRQLWVAPFFHLSNTEMGDYRSAQQIPESPVRKYLCMSGECLCGAYAAPGELREIELWFPETGKRIRDIERKVTAAGFPWGWGERPPAFWTAMQKAKKAGQSDAFQEETDEEINMLCTSCQYRRDMRSDSTAATGETA